MGENWKTIEGYDGCYEVSDLGRVRSYKRNFTTERRQVPVVRKLVPNVKTGYLTVMFIENDKRTLFYVHLLVLNAFIGPPKEGQIARHFKTNDLRDNRLSNLMWGTPSENVADMLVHGTHTLGERNGQAKLTQKQANEIRERRKNGEKGGALAEEFNVSQTTICRIKYKRRYTR